MMLLTLARGSRTRKTNRASGNNALMRGTRNAFFGVFSRKRTDAGCASAESDCHRTPSLRRRRAVKRSQSASRLPEPASSAVRRFDSY
jgi:hypothetical protein